MSSSGGTVVATGGLLAANNLSDVASRQTALNTLAGAVTSARYLRADGTNITVAAIVAGDVPTLNQNTTGTAGGLSADIAQSRVTGLVAALAAKAPVTNPTFTGTVTVGAPSAPGSGVAAQGSVTAESGFLGLDFVATEWANIKCSLDLRSFGGTPGAETATPSGTTMAAWHVGGWGTAGVDCAQIYCRATQTFTGAQSGTAWDFYTTTNGTNVKSIALTLDNDGAATFRAGITCAGAVAGVTTLGMAGAISGATNLFDLGQTASNAISVITATANTPGMRCYNLVGSLQLERVNGNQAAGTPIVSADVLFSLGFAGSQTTAANPATYAGARIRATATENWSGTASGTKLEFLTTPNTTVTKAVALTLDQDKTATFAGNVALTTTSTLTMGEGGNIVAGTTTGTKIGTGTTQKIGFYNATPVVQRASAAQAAVATTAATLTTPFGYTTQAQADAIVTLVNELRAAAVAWGMIKGSA